MQKRPCIHKGVFISMTCWLTLQFAHVGGSWAFLALLNRKLDALALGQRPESWFIDCGMMHKHIFAAIASNKAAAFLIAEPFDRSGFTFTHLNLFSLTARRSRIAAALSPTHEKTAQT
jgi:hypothetical protein